MEETTGETIFNSLNSQLKQVALSKDRKKIISNSQGFVSSRQLITILRYFPISKEKVDIVKMLEYRIMPMTCLECAAIMKQSAIGRDQMKILECLVRKLVDRHTGQHLITDCFALSGDKGKASDLLTSVPLSPAILGHIQQMNAQRFTYNTCQCQPVFMPGSYHGHQVIPNTGFTTPTHGTTPFTTPTHGTPFTTPTHGTTQFTTPTHGTPFTTPTHGTTPFNPAQPGLYPSLNKETPYWSSKVNEMSPPPQYGSKSAFSFQGRDAMYGGNCEPIVPPHVNHQPHVVPHGANYQPLVPLLSHEACSSVQDYLHMLSPRTLQTGHSDSPHASDSMASNLQYSMDALSVSDDDSDSCHGNNNNDDISKAETPSNTETTGDITSEGNGGDVTETAKPAAKTDKIAEKGKDKKKKSGKFVSGIKSIVREIDKAFD